MEPEIFAMLCAVEVPAESDDAVSDSTYTTGNKLKDPDDA